MKRTAKYETRPLNRGKRAMLLRLIDAFAGMKDLGLRMLGRTKEWHYLDSEWGKFRDAMKPRYRKGVPVHLQDQAMCDAVQTMQRWIDSCVARVHLKAKIYVQFAGAQRHYAYWLLRSYGRIGAVLRGEAPVPRFEIPEKERKVVLRLLRRLLRKSLGKSPRVHVRRSMALDSSLYKVFEHGGRLYVSAASLVRRKRIVLPLRGQGRIGGNIRVVWNQARGTASVHMTYDVRQPARPADGPAIGLDAGVTEVLASSSGQKYGQGYGVLLDRLSEETTATGKARNKLYQLARKAELRGREALAAGGSPADAAKASRIRRQNLGRRKLQRSRARAEATVKTMVGHAVRQALHGCPAVVVVEDLSHMRGRTSSRKLSRIVSRWARSHLRERLEFRSEAGRSRLETVNAAFTSQTCPNPACGFVHKDNRRGDKFHCLKCGRDGDADVVAGMNVLARLDDPEIRLWTPKERVKAILDERFRRRKESGNSERRAATP